MPERDHTLLFCRREAAPPLSPVSRAEEEAAGGSEFREKQTAQEGPQAWSGADPVRPSSGDLTTGEQ